jgi:hypothetical protein
MDLKDATLMMLSESAAYPTVASIAKTAYDQLATGEEIDYRVLQSLIDEASGKGVIRLLSRKYDPAARDAILEPILNEIGRKAPIRSQRYANPDPGPESDPLRASAWPAR